MNKKKFNLEWIFFAICYIFLSWILNNQSCRIMLPITDLPKLVQRDIPWVDQLRGVAGPADGHSFERPTAEGSGRRQEKEARWQAHIGGKKTFNLFSKAKERLGFIASTRFTNVFYFLLYTWNKDYKRGWNTMQCSFHCRCHMSSSDLYHLLGILL
jgi:hypothetical protein